MTRNILRQLSSLYSHTYALAYSTVLFFNLILYCTYLLYLPKQTMMMMRALTVEVDFVDYFH